MTSALWRAWPDAATLWSSNDRALEMARAVLSSADAPVGLTPKELVWRKNKARLPFAGAAFRQWIVEFYQENRLARDMLEMDGRPVRLADIRCPVLNIAASRDQIAPRPTTSIVTDRVGTKDATEILIEGGATSGSSSADRPARIDGQGSVPGSTSTTDRPGRIHAAAGPLQSRAMRPAASAS